MLPGGQKPLKAWLSGLPTASIFRCGLNNNLTGNQQVADYDKGYAFK